MVLLKSIARVWRGVLITLGVFVFCVLNLIVSEGEKVEAYSATFTTSSSVTVDAAPAGDGTSIQSESINVVSDCRSGYNLSIATPNGSDLYSNGNTANGVAFTAVDGISALNSSNNTNKWGYTLSANPTSSTVFLPLSATSSTLKTPVETASVGSDINDTFAINYGVKVDSSVAPGSYRMANDGAIVYYFTMDLACTHYTVSYNANGGTGSIANQNIQYGVEAELTSAEALVAPNGASYTDAGNNTITGTAGKLWTFWGWNTMIDGSGDWYKDKEAVTDAAQVGTTMTLYAQWKQATLADLVAGIAVGSEKVINHNTMQDMSPAACYNSTINTSSNAPAVTLLDYRGKVTTGENPEVPESYTVSKLADGLCWMTKNLNLGRSDGGGPNGDGTVTLTPDDSDITTDYVLPAHATTSSTTVGTKRLRMTNESGNGDNGGYYSWSAAVARNSSTSTSPAVSICPKNWDMPTRFHFTNLTTKSGYSSSKRPTAKPSSFLANGKFTNGSTFSGSNSYGYYWTATSSTSSAAYGARVSSSTILVNASTGGTYGGNKYYEKNIRCVAGQGKATFRYYGNGSTSGSVSAQTNVDINSTVAKANAFVRPGWAFNGWNTAADGSGIAIAANGSVAIYGFLPGSTINLYAQWVESYTLQYDGNGADNASTGMGTTDANTGIKTVNHTGVGTGFTLDLFAPNFKRSGYGFVGWSLDNDAWNKITDNDATNDPKIWGPNEYFTAPYYPSNSIVTLYAIWAPAETSGGNPVYFQNWSGCSGLTATTYNSSTATMSIAKNSITALTDQRDGMVYAIARLSDGNCWMIENLRLGNSVELTTSNTNIASNNSSLPLINVNNSDSSLIERSNYLSPSSSVAFDAASPTGKYGWCADATSALCVDQSRLNSDSTTANITPSMSQSVTNVYTHVDFGGNIYAYGNQYNWYSATAGYGNTSITIGETAAGDICPAGWALPLGGGGSVAGDGTSNGGFYYWAGTIGATGSSSASSRKLRAFPNNFVLAGYRSGAGVLTSAGNYGYYWASSRMTAENATRAAFNASSSTPGSGGSVMYDGFSVRCLIKP